MKRNKFFVFLSFSAVILFSVFAITLFYLNEQISTGPATDIDGPNQENTDNDSSNDEDNSTSDDAADSNDNTNDDGKDKNSDDKSDKETNKIDWGVDSAQSVDDDLYACVKDNFGEPEIWGRYLGDIKNVSVGLNDEEVEFLHQKDVKILVIYNHIETATGYDNGVDEAENAINYADDLNIPKEVAIFGDIEPGLSVDSAFIDGWHETLLDSKYNAGIYGTFAEDSKSKLLEAYNATSDETQENTVVWTAEPQMDITSKDNSPKFNPQGPEDAMVYGWQYAQDAEKCNIDTNLFKDDITEYLW